MYLSVFWVHIKLCTKQVSIHTPMMVSGKLLIFPNAWTCVLYSKHIQCSFLTVYLVAKLPRLVDQ